MYITLQNSSESEENAVSPEDKESKEEQKPVPRQEAFESKIVSLPVI